MKTKQDLFNYLKHLHISIKLHEHEPIFTSEQGMHLVERIPGIHCKNLFLTDDHKKQYWLVTVPFAVRTDLKKLAALLQVKKLHFASPENLMHYLGVTPGSVTPFALINDTENKVHVILDNALHNNVINIHPLVNTITASVQMEDVITFIKSLNHHGLIIDFNQMSIIDSF